MFRSSRRPFGQTSERLIPDDMTWEAAGNQYSIPLCQQNGPIAGRRGYPRVPVKACAFGKHKVS